MASTEWIESAWQAGRRKAPGGDGFIDRKAQHILGGAFTYEQAELHRAARYVAREVPDLAGILGLTPPARPARFIDQFGDDCLTGLLRALTTGQPDPRTVLHGMGRTERDAARQALTARLKERKVTRGNA